MNWTKVFAVVLTSKLFFLASCTGGMVLGQTAFDRSDGGGDYMDQGRAPNGLMSVIAVIPNAKKPGERKTVQVLLAGLEQFKQENPDYSFVPTLDKGEVNDPDKEMITIYTVTAAGPGKVMVETKFHHDVPPAPSGINVLARYEATDKEIKPLYTKSSYGLIFMIFGFALAVVLALVGYIFKWRLQLAVEGATPTSLLLSGIGRLGRLTALTCMWVFIALIAVAVANFLLGKLGLI